MGSNATDAPRFLGASYYLLEVRRSNRVKLLCRVGKQEKALHPRCRLLPRPPNPVLKIRRAKPWTGSAECNVLVASIRRITSRYPPYNSSLVGGLGLQERKAKSHSFLVRSPTRRSRGRGVTLWPVSPSLVRPRPLARALGASTVKEGRVLPSGRPAG